MDRKPIGPTAHGAIDYGFVAVQALAPTLLGLRGTERVLAYGFGATTAVINALTDHPLGLKPVVPLRVHGELETAVVPALLVLPWAVGALKQKRARRYFLSFFAAALATYLLTDYNGTSAEPDHDHGRRDGQRGARRVSRR